MLTSFKIEIPESVLTDLRFRLKHTRWTDEPENAGWNYGTNPNFLKELTEYWINEYDWRKHESALNKFPQFKTNIEGIEIHFVYVKGQGNNPKPLLLTHGWPDSFYRFHKVIPLLTDPEKFGGNAEQSFDVVIPSIPGFGFSDPVALDSDTVAILWAQLMKEKLGYENFYAAGGDIGTRITKSIANQFPDTVTAIHLTDVGYPTGKEDINQLTKTEIEFIRFIQKWYLKEGAFSMLHATKPQTLGYALNDSPIGLASWILEKFYAWSDNKGNITNSFTKDELLTNIMIYWVTQTINSSIRIYFENARVMQTSGSNPEYIKYVKTPTGVSLFPAEVQFPKEWCERMVNLKRFTNMQKGGHFSAMEEPELWVDEIRAFFYSLY